MRIYTLPDRVHCIMYCPEMGIAKIGSESLGNHERRTVSHFPVDFVVDYKPPNVQIETAKIRLEIRSLFPLPYQIQLFWGTRRGGELRLISQSIWGIFFADYKCTDVRIKTAKIRLAIRPLFLMLYQVQSCWGTRRGGELRLSSQSIWEIFFVDCECTSIRINTAKIRLEIRPLFFMLYQVQSFGGTRRGGEVHLISWSIWGIFFLDYECTDVRIKTSKIRLAIRPLFIMLYQVQSFWGTRRRGELRLNSQSIWEIFFVDYECTNIRIKTAKIRLAIRSLFLMLEQVQYSEEEAKGMHDNLTRENFVHKSDCRFISPSLGASSQYIICREMVRNTPRKNLTFRLHQK